MRSWRPPSWSGGADPRIRDLTDVAAVTSLYRPAMDDHLAGEVVPCSARDGEHVAGVLGQAFADDPVIGWMFNDPDRQRARIEQAFETWCRRIFLPKHAVVMHPAGPAVACWAPPERWRLTVTQQLRLLPSMAHIFGVTRLPTVLSGMQRMADAHPDARAHWYLGFLGTAPEHQGRGLGTRLLAHGLRRCDLEGTPAYLEASRPENVPFYERFGFTVHHELVLPGGPPVWGMWRDPHAAA